ncbi:protein kinase domain-containing protein [Jatrophihabitans sp.]|uniref:protein kinase domain-containing protein n=1 Tax=Jatrophihabitans sp. TaxID=1932789 RepID=UPI002F249C74
MTAGGRSGSGDDAPPPTQPDPIPRTGPGTTDEHDEPELAPPAPETVFAMLQVCEPIRLQGGQAIRLYRCTVREGSSPVDWPSEVFVKVYPPRPQLEQIWQAWRAAAQAPGIARLLEARLVDGWAFEATPYHVRGSLHDRLTAEPRTPLALAELEQVVAQVAQALSALHGLRIDGLRVVHRDIKPANILLVDLDEPNVEITDFGVTRLQQPPSERIPFVGSFEYAPPEALGAGTVSQGWDWWSLGITVLELVQGHHPVQAAYGHHFDREDFTATILGGPVPIPDTLPARWLALVRGLLSPADTRWGGEDVLAWLAGEELSPDGDTTATPATGADTEAGTGPETGAEDEGGTAQPGESTWRQTRPAFPYAGALYDDPAALAEALCADGSAAVRTVVAGVRWADLQSWATAWRADLGAAVEEVHRGFVAPRRHPDRSLAELLVRLHPGLIPRFRGHRVDLPGLDQLAAAALKGSRESLDTIEQLRASGALVAFAALEEQAALADVDETWQRWLAAAGRALDRARPLAAGLDLDAELAGGELTALLLQCAVSEAAVADSAVLARAMVDRATRRIPWAAELLRPESSHDLPARDALVILLLPLAFDPEAGRQWPRRGRPSWRRGGAAGTGPDAEGQAGARPADEPSADAGLLPQLTALPVPTPGVLPTPGPVPPCAAVPGARPAVPPASHAVPMLSGVPGPQPLAVPSALPAPRRLPRRSDPSTPRSDPSTPRSDPSTSRSDPSRPRSRP